MSKPNHPNSKNDPIQNNPTPSQNSSTVNSEGNSATTNLTPELDPVPHDNAKLNNDHEDSYTAPTSSQPSDCDSSQPLGSSKNSHYSSTTNSCDCSCFPVLILSIIITMFIVFSLILCSCHQHQEPIDTQMKIGSILCTDGQTLDYRQYANSALQAIGVVFYVNHDPSVTGKGYAVYLRDLYPTEFADTLGLEQGTSKDVFDFRGNENTYALQSNQRCLSPLGQAVFDMWQYGQSAYIPSVGQYKLLFLAKDIVNYYLEKCGGVPIENDADKCWYWSSTEVEGQSKDKAWLFSLCNGTFQETPKDQAHKSRPIITIY